MVQGSTSRMFDSRTLLKDLRALSADDMEGRRTDTTGNAKARAYIVDRFRQAGVTPLAENLLQRFTFTPRGGGRGIPVETHGVNVIGQITGRRRPNRYIVVSAHYDHLGVRNGTVFNGADDNASGTAALFTIAQYFREHRPQNSLIFAAFDAEELGLYGSQAFVATPPVKKEDIALDVNLDMIGRAPDDKLFAVGTSLNPFLKPYVQAVAAKAPVMLIIGHEDWAADSDHASFQRAGIPAIYLGVEDYAQHHKATDDFETMSESFYVRAVETSIALLESFDQNMEEIVSDRRN
jgi:Zn-dependent M28 family amino/carboxypeptidase